MVQVIKMPAKSNCFLQFKVLLKTEKPKGNFADNHGYIILRLCETLTFFSQQLKQSVIISNKYVVYELPRKLSSKVILSILEN